MKIFTYCSLSLALVFLFFFSLSSAHNTFSQTQEQYASGQSQESRTSIQSQEHHSSNQERYTSSQIHGRRHGSSKTVEGHASSQSQLEHDAFSQISQGHDDASSQSQLGHDDASSQSQLGHDASSKSQGRDDSSSQTSQRHDASSKSQGSKSQGHDDSSSQTSQRHDASIKNQGHDASRKSQGSQSQGHYDSSSQTSKRLDASSKNQGHDVFSQSQGHDAMSQENDASSKSQGHNAKSKENDASSKNQGYDAKSQGYDAKSQGNDDSSKSQEHDAKSQGDDVSSQSQGGLNASFEFHGSFKGCFSKVYAFGGSDTDTGNAHILGGLLNTTSSLTPTPSQGKLGDGRLVIDFICDSLSIPKISAYKEASINSSQGGINFAVAGSTTLSGDFFSTHNLSSLIWKDSPKSFQTQIEWFNKFLIETGCKGRGGSCKADIGNSLFWVGEMGLSDFMSAIGSAISLPHITEISVRIVCELLKAMLDNGAKYVVVQGLPPVGCLPAYMSSSSQKDRDHMGCVASANIGIINYNQILQERLQKFRKLYPHCSILYADYWNAYLTILTNPKKYEIEEPFKACCEQNPQGIFTINRHSLFGSQRSTTCKDPNKYISWDGIHLTEAMNKKLTTLFLNEGFCKPSFNELVKTKLKV